jgi:hypothetical protein
MWNWVAKVPLPLLLIGGLGCGGPPQAGIPRASDLALRAEVLEAMENGPLVVRVTLMNRSPQPVRMNWENFDSNAFYEAAPGWTQVRLSVSFSTGIARGMRELPSGAEFSQVLQVHKDYQKIPAGSYSVRVWWLVYEEPAGKGAGGDVKNLKLLAEPSEVLEVDVPAATPERLAALRGRMEEGLRRHEGIYGNEGIVQADILATRHHALAPIIWKMIKEQRTEGNNFDCIRFLAECPEIYPDLDARLARLAADPTWPAPCDVFGWWTQFKVHLPVDAWRTLTEADSVWTRALTYVSFPERCEDSWKEALRRDLRAASAPLPAAEFGRLLAGLDSEDFEEREKASERLNQMGERVAGQALRSLQNTPSAEVAHRLREVLARLEKSKLPPAGLNTLAYIGYCNTPEKKDILENLAAGAPDAWLTQQAKEKLTQRRNARDLPAK